MDSDLAVELEGEILLLSAEEGKSGIKVDKKLVCISDLIRTSLQNDPTATELPLPSIKSHAVLETIVAYINYHKGVDAPLIAKPIKSKVMKEVCADPWDAEFIDSLTNDKLYDLIMGANYLSIPSLVHLGCAKVATLIKGQPLEKIKDVLAKSSPSTGSSPPAPVG